MKKIPSEKNELAEIAKRVSGATKSTPACLQSLDGQVLSTGKALLDSEGAPWGFVPTDPRFLDDILPSAALLQVQVDESGEVWLLKSGDLHGDHFDLKVSGKLYPPL